LARISGLQKPIQIFWDGKLLPDLAGNQRVDRLPVVARGAAGGEDILLGVPKILSGTGPHQAIAVSTLIQEYDLTEKSDILVFDTTASNTGDERGTCTLLPEILGKELLGFACRHHVAEIILKHVTLKCLGPLKVLRWVFSKGFDVFVRS